MRKTYREYVENGICPTCKSKKAKEGIVLCQKCWELRMTPERKAKQRELAKRYKKKQRENGLCDRCKRPKKEGVMECDYCAEKAREVRKKKKMQVFNLYGGKCNCCGESTYEFLTIDHVNGGGNRHRQGGFKAYDIKNFVINGKVNTDFQVLCMNCNFAKGLFGYCPHKNINNG